MITHLIFAGMLAAILMIPLKFVLENKPNRAKRMKNKTYALVTGASMGIGKALTYECASRNINLLLVALPGKELDYLVATLEKYPSIEVHAFPVDLTLEDAPQKIYDWIVDNNFPIQILINNAGIGGNGMFEFGDPEFYKTMFRLNVMATTMLTYRMVPLLKQQKEAYILNLSSIEAYLPLPYKAVYTGTKNYIFSFSLALREELKHYNISVNVLCPGPTITNRGGLKRIKAHGKKSKIMVLLPRQVARIAIREMYQNKGIIIPGTVNRIMARLANMLPILTKLRILEKMFRVYRTESPQH